METAGVKVNYTCSINKGTPSKQTAAKHGAYNDGLTNRRETEHETELSMTLCGIALSYCLNFC